MREGKKRLYFCCAEEDSLYAIDCLRKEKKRTGLTGLEQRQLKFMEYRAAESCIYLAPAVIFAAANQESCAAWLLGSPQASRDGWYQRGIVWMKRHPAFLEKFGWKERRCAILAAGVLEQAESTDEPQDWNRVCQMLAGGWELLWGRMKRAQCLDAAGWKEMISPWKDSVCMSSGMAGVLLCMAILLEKPVLDRDQLWRPVQKLRGFTEDCLKASKIADKPTEDYSYEGNEKMIWLLAHFKNPQKPAYIREKARIGSEWLDRLFAITTLAGLPVSACETMTISFGEVQKLLELMEEERMSERQYMTFLMLYAISKELACAGRAVTDMPQGARAEIGMKNSMVAESVPYGKRQ